MADASTLPKPVLVSRYQRLVAAKKRAGEMTAAATERTLGTVLATTGGAVAGIAHSKWPSMRGQSIVTPASLAGGVLAVIGFTGAGGKVSEQALDLGQGILAGHAGILAFLAAEKRKAGG